MRSTMVSAFGFRSRDVSLMVMQPLELTSQLLIMMKTSRTFRNRHHLHTDSFLTFIVVYPYTDDSDLLLVTHFLVHVSRHLPPQYDG